MRNLIADKRIFFIMLGVIPAFAASTDFAFAVNTATGDVAKINLAIVYGITTVASFLIAAGYQVMVKNKNVWLMHLFFAVFAVNAGYWWLSVSKTLETALLANRLSYLGACFLPLCMLMAIREVCMFKNTKKVLGVLLGISVCVFVIAASPGYTTWYYADAELVFINGMAKLIKEYGPLHNIYYVYLATYFMTMIVSISIAYKRRVASVCRHAALLAVIVFLNIVIWLLEQLIQLPFEFLSVSYIISEMLLLLVYWMVNDKENEVYSVSDAFDKAIDTFMVNDETVKILTAREQEILKAILQNKRRKHIAEEFTVSENTIKKHTNHIYAKLGVTNRDELLEKFEKYK